MKKSLSRMFLLAVAFLFTLGFFIEMFAEGPANAQDHLLVPSLDGMAVKDYDRKDFDEYTVPLGPLLDNKADKVIKVEGKVTRFKYEAVPTKSIFEITKYYERLLKNKGFEILFMGKDDELGSAWYRVFYKGRVDGYETGIRFLSAKLASASGAVYVTVFVTRGYGAMTGSSIITLVDIVEPENTTAAPAAQSVEVSAAPVVPATPVVDTSAQLESKLKMDGFVLLKGLEFNEGAGDLRPGYEPILKDVAAIVKRNPTLKFDLKVYTDSNGAPDYQKQLSDKRASTLLRLVTLTYGADRYRVRASGMGFVKEEGMGEAGYTHRVVLYLVQ